MSDIFGRLSTDGIQGHEREWADACTVDDRTLADRMGEVQDRAVRQKFLRSEVDLGEVDDRIAVGGSIVPLASLEHWRLNHEVFRSLSRNRSAGLA